MLEPKDKLRPSTTGLSSAQMHHFSFPNLEIDRNHLYLMPAGDEPRHVLAESPSWVKVLSDFGVFAERQKVYTGLTIRHVQKEAIWLCRNSSTLLPGFRNANVNGAIAFQIPLR